MESLSKYNKRTKYLLCAIDLFNKYAWVVPVKDKRGASIVNGLQKIISKGRKPNKIWVDQGSEFYNSSFKDFLKIDNIEMYSRYNEGKSVVAERFIRTLKYKTFKHMTAISKNIYFDALDDIDTKYNKTVHRATKVRPIDVTSDSFAEYNEDSNKINPKFKVGDHVRISKYKIFLLKDMLLISQKKFLLLAKLKIQYHGLMLLVISMVKKLLEAFTKKNCKGLIRKNLE